MRPFASDPLRPASGQSPRRTRRVFLRRASALALAGACHAVLPLGAAGRPVRVQIGTLVQKDTSVHQLLKGMAAKWQQAAAGGLSVTFHTDGVMGSEADMIRRMCAVAEVTT